MEIFKKYFSTQNLFKSVSDCVLIKDARYFSFGIFVDQL